MKIISTRAHTVIGIIVGVVLLVAPTLFGFEDNVAAAMVPRLIGAFIIANELITTSPLSILKLVPMKIHIVIDCLTGAVLALSPWLFGFSNAPVHAWLPHVVVGILVIGYALMTSTADEKKPLSAAP
jgi:hypothetical protein